MTRREPETDEQAVLLRLYERGLENQRLAAELRQSSEAMAAQARARRGEVGEAKQQLGRARALLASLGEGTVGLHGLRAAFEQHGDAAVRAWQVGQQDPPAQAIEQRIIERTAQLRRLAAELEVAEGRGRRQLARDLHDDLGQTLAVLRLRLAPLRVDDRADVRRIGAELEELVVLADRSTRALAMQLAPALLQEQGLVPALQWLAEEMGRRFDIAVTIADDDAPKPLSAAARSIVYRAVRELLVNVAKHAGVDRAELRLRAADGRLHIQVVDHGGSFAPAPADAAGGGLGLMSVHERLTFLGGDFTIGHRPGEGTCAELSLPLEAAAPEG